MSSESRLTFCRPGMVNAPFPTTILNPSPDASPAPRWARIPEMIRASFGSATLNRNTVPGPLFLASVAADNDGARRPLIEHDHARTFRDRLVRIGRIGVDSSRSRHGSEPSRLPSHPARSARAMPHLANELVIALHRPTGNCIPVRRSPGATVLGSIGWALGAASHPSDPGCDAAVSRPLPGRRSRIWRSPGQRQPMSVPVSAGRTGKVEATSRRPSRW